MALELIPITEATIAGFGAQGWQLRCMAMIGWIFTGQRPGCQTLRLLPVRETASPGGKTHQAKTRCERGSSAQAQNPLQISGVVGKSSRIGL
jgi:hypothetical protein